MAPIFSPLVKNVGIDIGTTSARVYVGGRGVVLSEPSVVATDARQEHIIAIGNEAELMIQRSPNMVQSMTPLKDGVIADYRVTRTMIRYFVRKSVGSSLGRTRVMMAVPYGITDVEKRAMSDAIIQIGSREAFLLETPVAAALGENLPIFEPTASFVADIGGGTTDVAVIAMGGIVLGRSARIGGNDLNKMISLYMRDHFNVMVAEETIETIKLALGSAIEPEEELEFSFKGRDVSNGLSKQLVIRQSEVYAALQEPLNQIIEVIRTLLEQVPPELSADILDKGLLLSGATAKMHGLAERIANEFGIPVHLPEEPELTVVKGLGVAFKQKDQMDRLFISTKDRKGRA